MDESQKQYASERSPTQKITYFMIPFMWNSRKGKTIVAESGCGWGLGRKRRHGDMEKTLTSTGFW